ncbi:MAG: aminotransferase DegT, partial [Candidatus Chloroheliales bacterium]
MINMAKPLLGEEERAAIMRVLDSGFIVQGPMVKEFEDKWAAMCGVKHAAACSNGTTGLHLAMLAAGVGPGDEVICPAFTFIATGNAALYCGARPVFVDIDYDSFNIDVNQIEAAITPKTKAIEPVSLYGLPANMPAIEEIANRHGLAVIEDACQAVGASINGRRSGSWGIGVFSLYATKNVTTAEGGILTTNDERTDDLIRLLRAQGMRQRYHHEMLGYNYRMTDIQGAIGSVQMDKLDELTEQRRRNAAYYDANLRGVETPRVPDGYRHV